MKKWLVALLMACCMCISLAMAEEAVAPDLNMNLSQTRFAGPQEVTVTITVTNPSEEPMGPMALYYPNGKMIAEFGTPTLEAGESRTWEGAWTVTEEQLKQGRVIFAIQYLAKETDGSSSRKKQPYYVPVQWIDQPTHSVDIMLKSNPSTGYDWSWRINPSYPIHIESEYISDWQAEDENNPMPPGMSGHTRMTMTGRTSGLSTVTFTYRRAWEEDSPLYTLIYHLQVDEELNITILNSSFDW